MGNLFQSFVFSLAYHGAKSDTSVAVKVLERMFATDKHRYSRSLLSFVRSAHYSEIVQGVLDALRLADIQMDDEWKAKVIDAAYHHDSLTTIHALELAKRWNCPKVLETVKSFTPLPGPMTIHWKDALLDMEQEHNEPEHQITL